MDRKKYIKDIADRLASLNRKKDELTEREDRYDTEYCRYLLSEVVKLIPQMRDMHDLVDIAAGGGLDIFPESIINPSFSYGNTTCCTAMGFNFIPVNSSDSPDSSGSCIIHHDKQGKPYTIGRLFGIASLDMAYVVMVDIDWDPAAYAPGEEHYGDAVYIIPRDWIRGIEILFNASRRLCYHEEYMHEKKFTETLKTIIHHFPDWCAYVKVSVDVCADSIEKKLDKKAAELSEREKELEGMIHSWKDDSGALAVSTDNIDYII